MSTLSLFTQRDPFAEFDAVVRSVFGPVGPRSARSSTAPSGFVPPVEIDRDGQDAVVRVELPGLDVANDVTVEIDRGHLVVRGERRDERSAERDGRGLRELRYGSFRRTFRLPEHVPADAVSASYQSGVLSIRVAGAHAGSEPRRVEIGITDAGTTASGTTAVAPTGEPDQS
ncbi:MAG TPA: Hsp20/alpha crystallin family protein [Mycobacteriales bacterium]|nr:Hsp20/alpha crystallin family protein [Mycobacteriales bacterium]